MLKPYDAALMEACAVSGITFNALTPGALSGPLIETRNGIAKIKSAPLVDAHFFAVHAASRIDSSVWGLAFKRYQPLQNH